MEQQPLPDDYIVRLRANERMLLRRHGVCLRVDKITSNGKSAICSVAQVHRPFFRSACSAENLIDLAHAALVPLHLIGLSPLISPLPKAHKSRFPSIRPEDPFGIQRAMRLAAL